MYRNKLTVCAEVYHCHPDDLEPEQQSRLLEYIALYQFNKENQKHS